MGAVLLLLNLPHTYVPTCLSITAGSSQATGSGGSQMAAERNIRAAVVRSTVRSLCREMSSAVAGRIFLIGHHSVLLLHLERLRKEFVRWCVEDGVLIVSHEQLKSNGTKNIFDFCRVYSIVFYGLS